MPRIARKSDGRRIFSAEFKREQIGHVWRGEVTVAELSRKLRIAPSLLQRWKRLMPRGTEKPRARPSIAGTLDADQYIRELQLLVGKQTVELELLRAQLDALNNGRPSRAARGL